MTYCSADKRKHRSGDLDVVGTGRQARREPVAVLMSKGGPAGEEAGTQNRRDRRMLVRLVPRNRTPIVLRRTSEKSSEWGRQPYLHREGRCMRDD